MRWARAYVEFAAGEKRVLAGRARHHASCRPSAGPSAATCARTGTATPCPRFHVAWGTGTGVVEPFVAVGPGGGRGRAGHASTTGTGSTSCVRRAAARSPACAARCSPRTTRRAAPRPTATRSASFELTAPAVDRHHRRHRRQPRPGPPVLARAARHAARRRWSPACRRTWTAGCSTSPPRPASGWSTGTGCGTTPRACRTGTRSGPATASGSCPARRRCGSTRSAAGCPRRACPATTPSARCGTCAPPPDIAGHDHSWFVLTQRIIEKEFALSGSEQNPDITAKDRARVPARAAARQGRAGAGRGVQAARRRLRRRPTPWRSSSRG